MTEQIAEQAREQPTAFIAGGSAGIGLASAHALGKAGHRVVIGGRSRDRLDSAVAELRTAGIPVDAVVLDAGDTASCTEAVRAAVALTGRLDVLVNAVGSAPAGYFDEVAPEAWSAAFDGKVVGAVRLMTAVVPIMKQQRFGRIINIAGTAGREPDPWMVVAGAANAALTAVTNAASQHLASFGITVNAVSPGPTDTGRWIGLVETYSRLNGVEAEASRHALEARIPVGHPAQPADVASLVVYLASPEARHITGTAIAVDGGQSKGI